MIDLSSKTAVITGAGQGVGLGIATALAKHGLQGQFDLTWYIIVVLRALRLATNVRVPKINTSNQGGV